MILRDINSLVCRNFTQNLDQPLPTGIWKTFHAWEKGGVRGEVLGNVVNDNQNFETLSMTTGNSEVRLLAELVWLLPV